MIGSTVIAVCCYALGYVIGQRKMRHMLFGRRADRRYWL